MKRWMGLLCLFSLYTSGSVSAGQKVETPLTFSVLSYQVQSSSQDKLPMIGGKLDAFDIAGIQGCFASCDALLAAAHHPNKYYFSERPHWWNRANSGLASLSNFPLIEVKKLYYKAQADFVDESAAKGLLLMRYNVNGHVLDVYNTQMQAGEGNLDIAARQFQVLELMKYLQTESPEDHSVILIGDFNMGSVKPTIKEKLKLQDSSDALPQWWVDQLDRVLFRSGSNTVFKPIAWKDMSDEFVDAEGRPLSDSAPIAVQFELE